MYVFFAADGSGAPETGLLQNLMLLVPIVLIIVWGIWRRKKQGSTKLQVIIGLLSNINHNIKVMEAYVSNWRSNKRFKTGNWNKYQNKMEFLDPTLQTAIKESFAIATDFNEQIDVARKSKTTSVLAGLPVEKLRQPLTKSKQGISEWLQANLQTELYSRRRGLFG